MMDWRRRYDVTMVAMHQEARQRDDDANERVHQKLHQEKTEQKKLHREAPPHGVCVEDEIEQKQLHQYARCQTLRRHQRVRFVEVVAWDVGLQAVWRGCFETRDANVM